MVQVVRRVAMLAPLRSRPFALLLAGQALSALGDRVSGIALIWLLIGLTGSTVAIGSVLTLAYIPTILLLVIGGVWADRFPRRIILVSSDLLRAAVTLTLAVAVTLHHAALPAVFVYALLFGLIAAFANPALGSLLPSLVPAERYTAANALYQLGLQGASLVGPALGGLLISLWSVPAALLFDAVSFLVAVATVIAMGPVPAPTSEGRPGLNRAELLAGLRFLRTQPAMLATVIFFSLTNGINDVEAVLVPLLVRSVLHFPASAYGILPSLLGLGTIAGSLLIGMAGDRVTRPLIVIVVGMMVFGASIVAMGLAQGILMLGGVYLVFGLSFMAVEVTSSSLWQRLIPTELRGRVFSVMSTIAMGLNPLGLLAAGWVGQAVGIRQGLWIGGGAIVFLSALALVVPAMRRLDHTIGPAAK